MDPIKALKPKRRKKNKSRTQVSSSPSSSDSEAAPETSSSTKERAKGEKKLSDEEVGAKFTDFYMKRAAQEFAEDLDKVRGADDWRDDGRALEVLVGSLRQGVGVWTAEERRRVVEAREEKEGK